MATRRIIPTEKTFLDQDDPAKPSQDGGRRSDITPAVPTDVIFKLLGFTFAMIVCPIGSYFATVDTIFKDWYCGSYINPLTLTNMKNNLSGNSTFAGALAAVMANVVLIAYVIVAMREDQGERQQKGTLSRETEAKKDR